MDEKMEKADESTERKYLALMSMVSEMERRLNFSELTFLFLNIVIFGLLVISIFPVKQQLAPTMSSLEIMLVLFCLIVGMTVSTYWTSYASRLELNLKVKYFQMRYFERKMNREGENVFSGLRPFFSPGIGKLECPDQKEILSFPRGHIFSIDGKLGSIQPKHISLFVPFLFFIIYVFIFWFIVIQRIVLNI